VLQREGRYKVLIMDGSRQSNQAHPADDDNDVKVSRGMIYFRTIMMSDRDAIQGLHESWFPVDYKPSFFDSLCSGDPIMTGQSSRSPLFNCVACFRELTDKEFNGRKRRSEEKVNSFWSTSQGTREESDEDDFILWEQPSVPSKQYNGRYRTTAFGGNGSKQSGEDSMAKNGNTTMVSAHNDNERKRIESFYKNEFRFSGIDESLNCQDDSHYNEATGEQIIGCIVGTFVSSTYPSKKHISTLDEEVPSRDETCRLLVPDGYESRYSQMFYIMTLGTSREFRRIGLGSLLVKRVIDLVERTHDCGALYLHVITYNKTAMKFYERLGFMFIKEIKDYYTINSVNFDCYLFARYFHGNWGHRTSYSIISNYVWRSVEAIRNFIAF